LEKPVRKLVFSLLLCCAKQAIESTFPHQSRTSFGAGFLLFYWEKANFLAPKVEAFSAKFTLTVTVTVTRKFCGQQATATCFVRNE